MSKFWGYFWALYNYQKTEKAKHDFIDYLKALGIILMVIVIIWQVMLCFVSL